MLIAGWQIIPDGVPALLRELITRCWAFKPAERPSADELLLRSFAKIKEQLCPELIAKQQTRPQLGIERGRASGQGLGALLVDWLLETELIISLQKVLGRVPRYHNLG